MRSVIVCVFVPGFLNLDQMSDFFARGNYKSIVQLLITQSEYIPCVRKQKESRHVCYLSRNRTREYLYLYLISLTFIHLSF